MSDRQQLSYIASQAADARLNVELETEGMTLNIGPQHPATHGTLRIIARLDGEQVIWAEPSAGYMHRGYEKLTEVRTFPQVTTLSFDVLINHFGLYVTDYGDFGDGNLIFANDAGDELVSIARARVEPDVTTAWHRLKGVSERYIIVSGEGRVEIGELQPVDVCAGDVVRIPADVAQRISNTGNDDLVFYAVCSPPFEAGCYVSLE